MRDWFCFFLILALRVLFLGKGGGGERKERVNILNAPRHLRQLVLGWGVGGWSRVEASF